MDYAKILRDWGSGGGGVFVAINQMEPETSMTHWPTSLRLELSEPGTIAKMMYSE